MNRADIDQDIKQTRSVVPTFFKEVPDFYIGTEYTRQFDYDEFVREFDQIAAHVRAQTEAPVPA